MSKYRKSWTQAYTEVLDESAALQLKMAFDDAKIKIKGVKGGKLVIDKKDKKKVEKVIAKQMKKPSDAKRVLGSQIVFEEVELDEAKQGAALVVGGKVVARGTKKQLLKQIKKDKIKIDHKKNFLTFTGKEVGDSWDEERDYKDEYKKFQSSDKMRKYRAELNKYNREKGTYGNGDEKDASHKDGKIVGMEDQSINRGRAEKSRLIGSKRK